MTTRVKAVRLATMAVLAVLAVAGILLSLQWPFTQGRVARSLAGMTGSRIRLQGPVRLFFLPHPGLEARDVQVRRGSEGAVPLASVRRLRLVGSWTALLTLQHRLIRVEAEGLVVRLPEEVPPGDPAAPSGPQKTQAGELVADGAVLETVKGSQFKFEELRVHNLGPGNTMHYRTRLRNPNPRSTITAEGQFGPLNKTNVGATQSSGTFQLTGADLSQYYGVAGSPWKSVPPFTGLPDFPPRDAS